MERKIKKKHVDYSCGFPVVLLNVPVIKIHGKQVLDIDNDALAKNILLLLYKKAEPLTGNEVRFIRYYFGITLRDFARRLGVKHSAIVKWEKKQDHSASITWGIEKDIRLFILDKLCKSNKDFRDGYKALEEMHASIQEHSIQKSKVQPWKISCPTNES